VAKKKRGDNGAGRERGGFKSSRHGTRASAAGPKDEQKRAAEAREREGGGLHHATPEKSRFLRGESIAPRGVDGRETTADLIDNAFLAYNAARLREACQLFTKKMLEPDVTVGMTLTVGRNGAPVASGAG